MPTTARSGLLRSIGKRKEAGRGRSAGEPGRAGRDLGYLCILSSMVIGLLLFDSPVAAMPGPGDEGPTDPAVNENTGAANHRVPIEVPPGPGGLVPNLALGYSSRRGDGPYGVGWDLPLGEIACSVRFGVPDHANCPRFELDGQLLTRAGATNVYHSFVETFQKIEYFPATQVWEVTNPDGTIRRYGVDADARVVAGGGVARWLLSEVIDPFGNSIFITYDDQTDIGTRYPSLITYGAGATKTSGQRSIEFVFGEVRPDPIHDFAGGVERWITKRLTDIVVKSEGALVRRYAFGYSLAGVTYTTGRSRLSWSQVFGCLGAANESACSPLPRQEYEYTDSKDDGTTAQYSKFEKTSEYVVPFAGAWQIGAPPTRIGDVNGDGLPDLIKGGSAYLPYSLNAPPDVVSVEINMGPHYQGCPEFATAGFCSTFQQDADWTAALRNLVISQPRADYSQIPPDLSTFVGNGIYHVDVEYGTAQGRTWGVIDASYSVVDERVEEDIPAPMRYPDTRNSRRDLSSAIAGVALSGWIEAKGRMFLTDVDADGLADIVVSVRLSGVDKVVQPDGAIIPPGQVQRVSGIEVHQVFRNTGDPTTGWVRDDDLARGLPTFGVVQYESGWATETKVPYSVAEGPGLTYGASRVEQVLGPALDAQGVICIARGLGGLSMRFAAVGGPFGNDVCINHVDLDPRFHDFNGDGFLDIMVLELQDPEAFYQGYRDDWSGTFYRGADAPALPNNFARSRVYIQDPEAPPGADRWVRAPEFDLPSVPFQTVNDGGYYPNPSDWAAGDDYPFAHSQPVLRVPQVSRTNPYYGSMPENWDFCPGYLGTPVWEWCAPMAINVDLGVRLVDLNRDGLTDIIWSRLFQHSNTPFLYPGNPIIAEGVLLNTGTGWCSANPVMATHVGASCSDASLYLPPAPPPLPGSVGDPTGFAQYHPFTAGRATGRLVDLNADGYLDYLQTHADPGEIGNGAWLFDPAGATQSPPALWIRDPRYDLQIDYLAMGGVYVEGVAFAVLDINGDGAVDVVGDDLSHPFTGQQLPQAFVSKSKHGDLLRLIRNGAGGEISIAYESAVLQQDRSAGGLEEEAEADAVAHGESLLGTSLEDIVRWTAAPVVKEVRIAGPNREPDPANPASSFGPPTLYRYAQPRFCIGSRSDLGFRVVERTRPGGEMVKSHFYQVHGRAGRKSSVVVSENGVDVHLYEEDWEIQPQIPALVPGSIADPGVHVGRLAEIRSRNLYEGGAAGALLTRTFFYDDAYGYNFAERIVETRPTGTLVTLRRPASDVQNSIFGLVVEEKVFDSTSATLSDLDFLAHTTMGYFRGRPASRTRMVKRRGDSGAGAAESQTMFWDAYGNLTKRIVHAAAGDQVTDFCYDGDDVAGGEDAAWCPSFGNTHSVRVGEMDAAGGIVTFRPDPGTGTIVETQSTYTDEPATLVTLDAFGRPLEAFVAGDGSSWIRTSRTEYTDLPFVPRVVTRYDYPQSGAADIDAVWSSVVSDGFGGTWKKIGETPSGFVGTFTYSDPGARTVRESLPMVCSDASCSNQDGSIAEFAKWTTFDAIGRPLRTDTPDGFSLFDYTSWTKTSGPGTLGSAFDGILEKNGNGDLVRRAVDRDRIAWVEECGNSVPASTTDISTSVCTGSGSTTTYYDYEGTGELRTIYDARAVSPYDDPEHHLRYSYDTLGRVVQIDDPALSGTGHSLVTYDDYGNIRETTNARSQTRTHSYDILNRLIGISTPSGESDYAVTYRPGEKQASSDSSDDYQRTIVFDDLGRVEKEAVTIQTPNDTQRTFHTDFTYDLLGRVIEVLYPARHWESTGWKDTVVRYEYDRGFLSQICELGSGTDCSSAQKKYVSAMVFDSLGRPSSMVFPSGTRSFQYTSGTRRLARDQFASSTYQYTRDYVSYDNVGNILAIAGSETATPALDMNETYAYDNRNRLQQWVKEGTAYDYAYDDLGNLTTHAGETQVYDDPSRPHAIARRNLSAATPTVYGYDEDGNVTSIVGDSDARYFQFDSANRIVCLSQTSGVCESRVIYDVNGKRVAQYAPSGGFDAFIGDSFVYENSYAAPQASVEVMLDGKRIALERFKPRLRGATAGLSLVLRVPPPWVMGGTFGCVVLLIFAWGVRHDTWVLIRLRPLRAVTALGAASSLLLPSIALAGGGSTGFAPSYYWEITDPLGTGMVLVDENGDRVRHQVFTPFGGIHDEAGANFRTFYAGHRRDDRSGMFYMQARWYDPGSGRFLSVDPLHSRVVNGMSADTDSGPLPRGASKESTSGSILDALHASEYLNSYSYAANNPTNAVDPTGEIAILTGVVIVALSAAGGAIVSSALGGSASQGAALGGVGALGGIAVSAIIGATALTGTLAVGARAVANALVGGSISAGNQVGSNIASGVPAGEGVGSATASGAAFSALGSLAGDAVEGGLTAAPASGMGLGGPGESTGAVSAVGASVGNTTGNAAAAAVDSMGSGDAGGDGVMGDIAPEPAVPL